VTPASGGEGGGAGVVRGPVVDLRSDTITRPTAAMRAAIAAAEVGDDTLGDDPTVQRLQRRVAELLGKEAALLFPSGIMANQTAIALHAGPGTEVLLEATAHIWDWEDGAASAWFGVQLRPVPGDDGLLDADRVRAALRPVNPFQVRTALVCLENTHNAAGGRILPLATMRAIRAHARDRGIPVHLDGARLWNASVAAGIPEAAWAAEADTVMVTLSKGLGCPVGSLLAGDEETIRRAWRIRRRLGGSMRQAGILAAAGLHALDHHRERLADDHRRAAALARLAAAIPGVHPIPPETNIVMFDVAGAGADAPTLQARLADRGVQMTVFTPTRLRAVTHLDVDDDGIRAAGAALAAAVAG
jgi:threonine aldolase